MRIFLVVIFLALSVGACASPFESAKSRAARYEPRHIKNGFYQFDLATWPWSLAEFEERHQDSLRVINWGPVYNPEGDRVVGMLVLTAKHGSAHGSR